MNSNLDSTVTKPKGGRQRVFISYSQQMGGERALAEEIEKDLKRRGVEVFRDQSSLAAGAAWEKVIRQHLEEWATHFLVIVSPAALHSEWVQRELDVAQARHEKGAITVLWLQPNRQSGLPEKHWLHQVQQVCVLGRKEESVREREWCGAVASALLPEVSPVGLPPELAYYIESRTKGFVGREGVFKRIESFLATERCGYLMIVGDPGIGKTAIMAQFARRNECIAHFFRQPEKITSLAHFLTTVGEQFERRFAFETGPAAREGALVQWIAQAAKRLDGERLLLVIDALDEFEPDVAKAQDGSNILGLPRDLPEGVFVLLSCRDLSEDKFPRLSTAGQVGNETLSLVASSPDNLNDVERYVRAHFDGCPEHPWLKHHNLLPEQAVLLLVDRSEGNFMYLTHILPALLNRPAEIVPKELPKGLEDYYRQHWDKMMLLGAQVSDGAAMVFDVIYVLAVSRTPTTAEQMAGILRSKDVPAVSKLINQWREFLQASKVEEKPFYRIYHSSFSDFLAKKDNVKDAGARARRAHSMIYQWLKSKFAGPA